MKALDYLLLVFFLGLLACIVFSSMWWHRTGRHNPAQPSIWGRFPLIYSTVLPVLLLAETMCNVPLSYATLAYRSLRSAFWPRCWYDHEAAYCSRERRWLVPCVVMVASDCACSVLRRKRES